MATGIKTGEATPGFSTLYRLRRCWMASRLAAAVPAAWLAPAWGGTASLPKRRPSSCCNAQHASAGKANREGVEWWEGANGGDLARRESMTVKEFDEFVERQHGAAAVDWDRERDEWLAYLDELYGKIETMLGKYVSSGQISIRFKPIEMNEENLGSYQARQMILRIGRQEVDITPRGTRFIGFKGYVEVIGSAGKASLALANNKLGTPQLVIHELNEVGTAET